MNYLSSFCKIQVLREFKQLMSVTRKISVNADTKVEKTTFLRKKRDTSWISPHLTALRLEKIKSVTGIVVGLNCISWVKMSIPELHLLDWNLQFLSQDFVQEINDSSILALAYDVKDSLPDSDLYVMESFPVREYKHHGTVNKIKLSSMITVLLNGFNKDTKWEEKVIFQKQFIMNYLFDVQIASERISTRNVVENILFKSTYLADCDSEESSCIKYPTIAVDYRYIENYKQFSLEKQESLSLALLLTLSFIDVNVFKNQKSLEKILKRRKS